MVTHSILASRQRSAGTRRSDSRLGVDGTHESHCRNDREEVLEEVTRISIVSHFVPRIIFGCKPEHKIFPVTLIHVPVPLANRSNIQDHTRDRRVAQSLGRDEKLQKRHVIRAVLVVRWKRLRHDRGYKLGDQCQYLHDRVEEAGITNVH